MATLWGGSIFSETCQLDSNRQLGGDSTDDVSIMVQSWPKQDTTFMDKIWFRDLGHICRSHDNHWTRRGQKQTQSTT